MSGWEILAVLAVIYWLAQQRTQQKQYLFNEEILKLELDCDQSATKPILTPHLRLEKLKLMAERVGFEPTVPLTVHKLSKPAP